MENPTPSPSAYPTLYQGFGILLLFFILSMGAGLFISLGHLSGSTVLMDWLKMVGYFLSAGGTLFVIARIKSRVNGEKTVLRSESTSPLNYLIVVILTFLAVVVIDPLTSLLPMPEDIRELFNQLFGLTIPAFITAVILAPVLEELIFRGIVLEGFLRNYSPVKAIFWTNVLFGLAHLNPWQFMGAFLMGILISWVYYKTRNLLLPVLMHFVNNLGGFLFIYITRAPAAEASLEDIFSSLLPYYILVITGAIILILFFWFSPKLFPVRQS